ncbi:unnamed protein product [Mycena citricolor]|uniref:Uncharacterized protein n=1 Tax=Mycena citricolor TaxID=2018698 RepID=A0AAD2HMU0_9AGAR|nr:unnamed protein product [Mycena citricolor]CAK5279269.1 unnamed protein product [Mycena citricolor]CAK5280994.1 unnamed protein product [Mycena citricolor]
MVQIRQAPALSKGSTVALATPLESAGASIALKKATFLGSAKLSASMAHQTTRWTVEQRKSMAESIKCEDMGF